MYKQILIPDKKNHSISLPKDLYGKKVEVTVVEIIDQVHTTTKTGKKHFLDDIEAISDFPGIDTIREKGWPERW